MAFHNPDKAENAVGIHTVTLEAQANADDQSLEQTDEREVLEHPDEITYHAQAGIQKAEATALVWSRKALNGTYAWHVSRITETVPSNGSVQIWLCFFVLSMQSSISNNMIYYAYAKFASAPQISQAYIVSTIVGGVLQLPIAKTLNIWGRTDGLLTFLAVFIIGLIVIASCDGPNVFAAGYTLYWIGYSALNFILSVFVLDASGLKNRAFVYAFIGTPTIFTAFAGPIIAQAFVTHSTWRWSYGCFAIISRVFIDRKCLKSHETESDQNGIDQAG